MTPNREFIKLEEESGEFLLSDYGNGVALGFRGDEDFIRRCENFAINHGLAKRTPLCNIGTNGIHYLCTSVDKIEKALMEFYSGYVVLHKLVAPSGYENVSGVRLPSWSESEIRHKAKELKDRFIQTRLIPSRFMDGISTVGLPEVSFAL